MRFQESVRDAQALVVHLSAVLQVTPLSEPNATYFAALVGQVRTSAQRQTHLRLYPSVLYSGCHLEKESAMCTWKVWLTWKMRRWRLRAGCRHLPPRTLLCRSRAYTMAGTLTWVFPDSSFCNEACHKTRPPLRQKSLSYRLLAFKFGLTRASSVHGCRRTRWIISSARCALCN